jgi:CDP-glucose 4,6-dehydratase
MKEVGLLWHERPVMITGGTGFLGGWLTEALVARGAHVVCLIRDRVPGSRLFTENISRNVVMAQGDVADQSAIERILGEYEIRTVFHLAAQTIVQVAERNPVGTFESNIKGTWSILESCRRSSLVSEVIVASSDKAYGTQRTLPYTEETPLQGKAPYDVSKSCADLIAQSYSQHYGMPVCITRCGNFFGGGDLNWSRLIPGVMRDLIAGRSPVIRSNGLLERDYLYIEDGVSAYLCVAEALMERRALAGRAYNFSLDRPLTVMQVLSRIFEVTGVELAPNILGQASTEISAQHLNSELARTELGWQPEIGLDDGLRRTSEWYRRYFARDRGASVVGPF